MSNTTEHTFLVKVVLLQENETWIAQGLNYDITGHGATITAAIENFGKTFIAQALIDIRHGEKPLGNVPEAPRFYWDRFEEAAWRGLEQKRFEFPDETPPAFVINGIAADTRIYG